MFQLPFDVSQALVLEVRNCRALKVQCLCASSVASSSPTPLLYRRRILLCSSFSIVFLQWLDASFRLGYETLWGHNQLLKDMIPPRGRTTSILSERLGSHKNSRNDSVRNSWDHLGGRMDNQRSPKLRAPREFINRPKLPAVESRCTVKEIEFNLYLRINLCKRRFDMWWIISWTLNVKLYEL